MKVSIIVPVYNTEKYIGQCVESILAQTHKDFEAIFIDDGSTDKSGAILDEYKKRDSRIIVNHTKNMGVSNARNLGISCASGEFIAFVDSDDTIKSNMYENLIKIAEKYKTQIVTSDFTINGNVVKNSLEENAIYDETRIKSEVLPQFTYNNSIGVFEFKNKIFNTKLIKENNILFYEGFSYQEDLMFMINIYANAKSLYYIPQSFYIYVPLSTGLYSSYRSDGGEKFIKARELMLSLIQKYDIKNIDFNNFNIAFLYNISFFVYRTGNYIKEKKQMKQLVEETLKNTTVVGCCKDLLAKSTSFDRRIAMAIANGNIRLAVLLIRFVYSGKAKKVQSIIAKIKGKR